MGKSKKIEQEKGLIKFLSSHSICFVVNKNGSEKSIIQLLTSMMNAHPEFDYGYAGVVSFKENHVSYVPSHRRAICTKDFMDEFCRKYKFTVNELISRWVIAETSLADYSERKTNTRNRKRIAKRRKAQNSTFTSKSRIAAIKSLFGDLSYENQLKTKEWKDKRAHILKLKGRKCSICGVSHNLQIHHLRYLSGHLAWEYDDKDLIVVCGRCHQRLHGLL